MTLGFQTSSSSDTVSPCYGRLSGFMCCISKCPRSRPPSYSSIHVEVHSSWSRALFSVLSHDCWNARASRDSVFAQCESHWSHIESRLSQNRTGNVHFVSVRGALYSKFIVPVGHAQGFSIGGCHHGLGILAMLCAAGCELPREVTLLGTRSQT